MITKDYTEIRDNLETVWDAVVDDNEIVAITCKGGKDVVMLSLVEYNNLMENYYIRRSAANYNWIMGSIEQLNKGETQVLQLPEE